MTPPDPKPAPRAKKPYAGLARTGRPKPRRRAPRAGVQSTVNPPAAFRAAVAAAWDCQCVVCGARGVGEGAFDPAHLIPAQMIRVEARTTPALADFVYAPALAVWACRSCHFANDYRANGARTFTRELLERRGEWLPLVAAARAMDAFIDGDRCPFAAYLDSTYPLQDAVEGANT